MKLRQQIIMQFFERYGYEPSKDQQTVVAHAHGYMGKSKTITYCMNWLDENRPKWSEKGQ